MDTRTSHFPLFRWPPHWRAALLDSTEQGERFANRTLAAKFHLNRFLGLDFDPRHDHITIKEAWDERVVNDWKRKRAML